MSSPCPSKIVYGICGIGLGHSLRQLPILEHLLAAGSHICMFTYGRSYEFFQQRFSDIPNVTIQEVAVPFYVGNRSGLDFRATREFQANRTQDFLSINCAAMETASQVIGLPDLVITDYEPTAAQYAYAYNAPLITIDQQSKYLCHEKWPELAGHSCRDEVMRLSMLFPKAEARVATSFFRVQEQEYSSSGVEIHGPVIRPEVIALGEQEKNQDERRVLAYISSQQPFGQSLEEVLKVFETQPTWQFDIYVPKGTQQHLSGSKSNVSVREHGSPEYLNSLANCSAVISTAGHTLLSEAMYLAKPVLAVPLPVYEQHMNAAVIAENGFGRSCATINSQNLAEFLESVPQARDAILCDDSVLIRTPGQASIVRTLDVWERSPARSLSEGLREPQVVQDKAVKREP